MSSAEIKKKSIIEIFNEMEYEEKLDNSDYKDKGDNSSIGFKPKEDDAAELNPIFKTPKEPKSFDTAVNDAVKAQKTWKALSTLQRADSLQKIWKALIEISNSLSKLKKKILTLADYFDYYTDLAVAAEEYKNWKPSGAVLIVLTDYSPCFILGATIPPALATGCSVIVLAPNNKKLIPLFLQGVLQEAGLQEGLFNVVIDFDENDIPVSEKINKVFFCGSYLSVQKYYIKSLTQSFSFFCPNNTAAFILESCDLNAAVDKIVTETWGKEPLFAITTVVVQESIYNIFFEKLQHRVEQLIVENINTQRFKDKNISLKINKKILEVSKAGATVTKCTKYENATAWVPVTISNYQNQDIDEDVPILKLSVCRTAKEGVALLNNSRYGLATSVWTEISAQALEISSMLDCPNVWINCHGVSEAGVPLQPSGISGNCVLGGSDGLLQYMSFRICEPVERYKSDDGEASTDKINSLQMGLSAQKAFKNWQKVNRRRYLKDIADAMEKNKELSDHAEIARKYAHFGNLVNFLDRNSTQEFLVIRKKIPIGVILLIVNGPADAKNLTLSIIPAIALGNAVIVVLKEDNPNVQLLIKTLNDFLPKNIVNVVVGINTGIQLASDPNIQAIWIDKESTVSGKYLEMIRNHSAKDLKHMLIIPSSLIISQHLFEKECLRNKTIWLPKVDQFP